MKKLTPEARALLDASRPAASPSAADRARVREALEARLADPTAVEPQLDPAPLGSSSAAVPWGAVAAGAVVVAAGAWWALQPAPSSPELAQPQFGPERLEIIETRPLPPAAPQTAPETAPRAVPPPVRAAPTESPTSPRAPSRLAAEAELLRAVQAALRDAAWARALELARRHRTEFPQGLLEEERLAAEVIAACKTGETAVEDEARRVLEDRYPGSVHGERTRQACDPR